MHMVIIDEAVFSPSYVPERLPHREEQIQQLDALFGGWLRNPGRHYPRVVRRFWSTIKNETNVKFVHINCFIYRNFSTIIGEIAKSLNIPFPRRGLSKDEFLSLLIEHLRERDLYIFLALDDAFNLSADVLSTFIRLGQESDRLGAFRIALAVVGHSDSMINNLDPSTRGIMGKFVIRFPPYTRDQIFDIILERAQPLALTATRFYK